MLYIPIYKLVCLVWDESKISHNIPWVKAINTRGALLVAESKPSQSSSHASVIRWLFITVYHSLLFSFHKECHSSNFVEIETRNKINVVIAEQPGCVLCREISREISWLSQLMRSLPSARPRQDFAALLSPMRHECNISSQIFVFIQFFTSV